MSTSLMSPASNLSECSVEVFSICHDWNGLLLFLKHTVWSTVTHVHEIFHRRKQSPYGFFTILLSQDQVRIEGRRRQPALPVPTVLWQILAYSVLSDFTSNTEMVKKGKHIIVQLFAPTPHKLPLRLPGTFTTSTNDTCAYHHQFENCEIVVSASE